MFLHRHNWSQWSITERGSVVFINRPELKIGVYLVQDRHCLTCGKTEIDQQNTGTFQNGVHQLIPESKVFRPKHDKVN